MAEHRGTPTPQIANLPDEALILEAGAIWREWIMERARGVRALPDKERPKEIGRLRRSDDEDDRYVAMLVMRWEARK